MISSFFGTVKLPGELQTIADVAEDGTGQSAINVIITRIFTIIGVVAGIYFVIQILLAGFAYISASGDQKKAEAAWAKIYQSIIGLVIVSSAFLIAGVISRILGWDIINNPVQPLTP